MLKHWHHGFGLRSHRDFSLETHIRTLLYGPIPGKYSFVQDKTSPVRELWVLSNTLKSRSDQCDMGEGSLQGKEITFMYFKYPTEQSTVYMFQTYKSFLPRLILQIDSRLVFITSASKSLLYSQLTSSHLDVKQFPPIDSFDITYTICLQLPASQMAFWN